MVDISFVVPMYNADAYLSRTLDSIVKMVGNETSVSEVILIDDGSVDMTLEVAQKYVDKYPFFKLISSIHQGVSATRNLGIDEATGKYVTFIDCDDIFENNFVKSFRTLSESMADIIVVDVEKADTMILKSNLDDKEKISLFKLINRDRGNNGICSKIFNRNFLLAQDLKFDTDVTVGEDALFNYQAIDSADSVAISSQKFYYVLESHTLPYYSPNILKSELKYRQKTAAIFKPYFAKDTDGELLWTDNKIKLTGYIRLVDRYFGPQYNKKEISLAEAAKYLRDIAENYAYTTSFEDKRHDNVLGLRYRVFRRLLAKRLYKTTLIFNKYMDKIKKTQRWK
ncbi:glycosyltransferase family 2 protein [Ligilactobacillus animalis]